MLTIAGGILLAVGIVFIAVNCLYVIAQIISLPFRIFGFLNKRNRKLPVRHYYEELPDHLGGSDNF